MIMNEEVTCDPKDLPAGFELEKVLGNDPPLIYFFTYNKNDKEYYIVRGKTNEDALVYVASLNTSAPSTKFFTTKLENAVKQVQFWSTEDQLY